jgi:hypothetical protein
MSAPTIVYAALTLLLAAAPASAEIRCELNQGRDHANTTACNHESSLGTAVVARMLNQHVTHIDRLEPARQTMTVWFHKPVKIGDRILLGRYFIEHDNNRMARGRPCTHIYAASDPRLPVVAFRCTHLNRPMSARPVLVMRPLGDANGMAALLAFQFAGERAAHGVPTGR